MGNALSLFQKRQLSHSTDGNRTSRHLSPLALRPKWLLGIITVAALWVTSGCNNADPLKNVRADNKTTPFIFPAGESSEVLQMKQAYGDSVSTIRKQNKVTPGLKGLEASDPPRQFVDEMKNLVSTAGSAYANDIAQQVKDNYPAILDRLITEGNGTLLFGTDQSDRYLNNALKKLKLSETAYWEGRKDNTYHSYDLIRNLGPETGTITLSYVYNLLLNAYSYPGYKMEPVSNVVNGGTRLVFGSITDANNKDTYVIPGGIIEQSAVPGGVLNITTTDHSFYKGTIRKAVFKYRNNLFIVTHGEGINRFSNLPYNLINAITFNQFSRLNDTEGPLAFSLLDKQLLNALGR